jgi:flavin-dependent dehydrogenase
MDDVTRAAYEAYRALCRLEDELDRYYSERRRPTGEADREMLRLVRRWETETLPKMERSYAA